MQVVNSRRGDDPAAPGRSEILAQMEEILRSPAFRTSKRSQEILTHLVRHALDGEVEGLKERVIGQEIFGRPVDYDTGQDSIVRAKLNEVRRRLAQYFGEAGAAATVRIDIPVGNYVPEFHWLSPASAPARSAGRRTMLGVSVGAAILVLAALALYGGWRHRPATGFDAFWQPFFDSPNPVTICVAHPKVYNIFGDEIDQLVFTYRPGATPRPDEKPVPGRVYSAVIIPEPYNFVGVGDAHALARLFARFEAGRKACQIRRGNDMSFAELRRSPSVLIGGYSNQWSLSQLRELRYIVQPGLAILDQKEGKQVAAITRVLEGVPDSYVDYAIISRLIRSRTGEAMLGVVGLSHYGTMAAAELVTDRPVLESTLREVPGWSPGRNCQIVLRVNVVIRAPEKPEIVTSYVW